MKTDTDGENWVTTGEAAKALGRSSSSIRRWADEGLIKMRVSPGGHRQVLLPRFRAHLIGEQKSAAKG